MEARDREWLDEGLTNAGKYGSTTPSRVTGAEAEPNTVLDTPHNQDCEFYELPHCAHPGACWLALERGEPVDGCACLKRFI